MESHLRTVIRGITWRVIATVSTIVAVFLVTGNTALSLGIGVIDVVSKLILYYAHERAWLKIGWGKHATQNIS